MAKFGLLSLTLLVAVVIMSTATAISVAKQQQPRPQPRSPLTSYNPPPLPPPTPSSHPPPSSPAPPPPPTHSVYQPPQNVNREQLNSIIDALMGAGDFTEWIEFVRSTSPSSLPLSATILTPTDRAISQFPMTGMNLDPFLIPYHTIPQRLTFSDLQDLPVLTRLPTMVPTNFITITNNSRGNFTFYGSQLTHADIFVNAALSIHGINSMLPFRDGVSTAVTMTPPPLLQPPASAPQPQVTERVEGNFLTRSWPLSLLACYLLFVHRRLYEN